MNTWTWPIIDALKASASMLDELCACGDGDADCRTCYQAKENRKLAKHFEDNFRSKR